LGCKTGGRGEQEGWVVELAIGELMNAE